MASTSQALHTTRGTTEIAADRVLSFAVEGLDMLKSVTGIFSESVDRADACVVLTSDCFFFFEREREPGSGL